MVRHEPIVRKHWPFTGAIPTFTGRASFSRRITSKKERELVAEFGHDHDELNPQGLHNH